MTTENLLKELEKCFEISGVITQEKEHKIYLVTDILLPNNDYIETILTIKRDNPKKIIISFESLYNEIFINRNKIKEVLKTIDPEIKKEEESVYKTIPFGSPSEVKFYINEFAASVKTLVTIVNHFL